MEGVHTRTIVVTKKRTLASGEVKVYTSVKTYKLNGYVSKNGERVQKVFITDEQKAEMKKRYADGVKKTRLEKDYHLTFARVTKILDED